ncbi:MAG TPA: Gfo/Idh/MocA family oxidoreductase [Terracidiphilus sp.]
MISVGVIGAGLIGQERLQALDKLRTSGGAVNLVGLFDVNEQQLERSAAKFGVTTFASVDALLAVQPDWVFVSLPHDVAVQMTEKILKQSNSLVLLEKPMGRDLEEARRLRTLGGDRLRIGFNYRFYEGIRKALQDARNGRFGELISVEFTLGHGCGPGQEKTWKLDEERAGGGCLIDPGIHLLDLCMLLAPDGFQVTGGASWSGFWKTGIEEDVSLVLASGKTNFILQISVVRWLSEFRMCVRGVEGYGTVTGRNRSYGPQRYAVGTRWGWRSAPSQVASETVEIETDGMDVFVHETEALLFPPEDQLAQWPAPATTAEALQVMSLLDQIRAQIGLRRNFS